jgi:hypothetical protein
MDEEVRAVRATAPLDRGNLRANADLAQMERVLAEAGSPYPHILGNFRVLEYARPIILPIRCSLRFHFVGEYMRTHAVGVVPYSSPQGR